MHHTPPSRMQYTFFLQRNIDINQRNAQNRAIMPPSAEPCVTPKAGITAALVCRLGLPGVVLEAPPVVLAAATAPVSSPSTTVTAVMVLRSPLGRVVVLRMVDVILLREALGVTCEVTSPVEGAELAVVVREGVVEVTKVFDSSLVAATDVSDAVSSVVVSDGSSSAIDVSEGSSSVDTSVGVGSSAGNVVATCRVSSGMLASAEVS